MAEDIAVITMGKTPQIATEFITYLRNALGKKVVYVYLISTSDPFVYGGSILAKKSLEERFQNIYVQILKTDIVDLDSSTNLNIYINSLMRELKDKVLFPRSKEQIIHFCIAGGRKNMVVISTIFSMVLRPVVLYHVVHKKYDVHMDRFRGLEDFIISLSKSSDESEIDSVYRELKNVENIYGERIDDILYPPLDEYEVIEMYVPPYPRDYMDFIRYIISNVNGVPISKLNAIFRNADSYIAPLLNVGLIEYREGGIIAPTKNLLRYIEFFE